MEFGKTARRTVSSRSRQRYRRTSTALSNPDANGLSMLSRNSAETGDSSNGNGYGTTCGTKRTSRILKSFARHLAVIKAQRVASSVVKTRYNSRTNSDPYAGARPGMDLARLTFATPSQNKRSRHKKRIKTCVNSIRKVLRQWAEVNNSPGVQAS